MKKSIGFPAFMLILVSLFACGGKDEPADDSQLYVPSSVVCDDALTTTSSLTFTWDNISNADSYAYKLTSGGQPVASGNTAYNHITLTELAAASQYTFQVRSIGSGAYISSSWSTPLNASTLSSNTPDKIVAAYGSGDCRSVAEAIASVPSGNKTPYIIYIKEGTYKEKLVLPAGRDNVIFVGDGADKTVITYDDYNGMYTGETSYCFRVSASDVKFLDLTVSNTFANSEALKEQGITSTQAMAVEVRGDRTAFYDCSIKGYQDTFYGRYEQSRIYLKNCYIEGNVDFIYGAAVMVFDHCTTCVNRNNSVLTAPSTSAASAFGIVFLDCNLTSPERGTKDFNGTAFSYFYLGRPWQNAPKAVFLRCTEPATLHADGWTTMNSVTDKVFAEWKCTGDGAKTARANGGVQLTDAEAEKYTVENIFKASTNPAKFSADWVPDAKPVIVKNL